MVSLLVEIVRNVLENFCFLHYISLLRLFCSCIQKKIARVLFWGFWACFSDINGPVMFYLTFTNSTKVSIESNLIWQLSSVLSFSVLFMHFKESSSQTPIWYDKVIFLLKQLSWLKELIRIELIPNFTYT